MKKTLMSSSCGVRRTWKNIFFLCAWLLLIFCVMRPYKGSDKVLRQRTTRDILVLFDVSKSMNVRDCFGQSRMKYGKNWVRKLAKSLELDRFGLMSFSGQAFLECPLTSDFYSFELGLDELSSELAPIGGTDIGEALDQALVELDTGGSHKAVIMLSDGEDISGILDDALTKFKEKGVQIMTVQLGDEGKPGLVYKANGQAQRGRNGEMLYSTADSKTLKKVASETDGIFIPFNAQNISQNGLQTIQKRIIDMDTSKGEEDKVKKPRERYQLFLCAAIALLILRLFIGERKRMKTVAVMCVFILSPQLFAQLLPSHQQMPPIQQQQKAPQAQQTPPIPQFSEKSEFQNELQRHDDANLQALTWYKLANKISGIIQQNPKLLFPQAQQPAHLPVPNQPGADTPEPEKKPAHLEQAINAYGKAIELGISSKKIHQQALHNRAALKHFAAREGLLKDPDKALENVKSAVADYRSSLTLKASQETAFNLQLANE
ncbi:MAG: VWA domain-containing protein, partial [Lentisphaeraceae bacterium]|nr:VWA domain-containing protein [Lentisphaeraceae bacterium]